MKGKSDEKVSLNEHLARTMLEYYSIQLEDLKSKKAEDEKKRQKEQQEIEYIKKMWKKFHSLKDKTLISDLSKILRELAEKKQYISFLNSSSFECMQIRDYFMKMGIDIKYIFHKVRTALDNKLDYFEEYGFKEQFRLEKIKTELEELLEKYKEEKMQRDLKEKVNKFVEKAKEMEMYDVTSAHIKNIAVELGEDTSGILNQLQNAVSTQLRLHSGNKEKRKRDLTKSIKIEVLKRDNYVCQECGKGKSEGLHVHHITPHSLGGTDEMDNLITLCRSCNASIGDRKYNPPDSWIGRTIYTRWEKDSKKS
ncbi:MAG: HNH endonuclease [Candidatus Pacearchaeota archaeon]|nr:HNH endonuclease [Candidatus Pacearchaeota archaeon]